MRIHAFLECSLVNGPGRRAVLWVQGCRLACPNCWNPKSHSITGGSPVSTRDLARRILREYEAARIEGLTLSGGEPLHQITEVLRLLRNLKREAQELSTGLFSGYTEHELQHGRFQTYFPSSIWLRQAQWRELESLLDFAVLGRYNQRQPSADPLVTSRNQQLRFYSKLRDIAPELWDEERTKAAQLLTNAAEEAQQVMRTVLAELVQHLAERLQTTDEGKPVRLHKSAVSNLLDFLDTLDFRNVTNDADLKRLADEARALLTGVNMKDLKSTGDLRQRVREGMQQIATQLDSMLVSRGRKIRFDEE